MRKAISEIRPLVVKRRIPSKGERVENNYNGNGYIIVRHSRTKVVEKALSRLGEMIQVQVSPKVTHNHASGFPRCT